MTVIIQRFFIFSLSLFILLVSTNGVLACSCSTNGTVDEQFAQTANVVILKLQSVEKPAEGEKIYGYGGIKQSKLTVEKVFKGNLKVGEEMTFAQGGGADCIWTFSEKSIGTEFLFYLGAKPVKGNVSSRMPSSVIASTSLSSEKPVTGEVWVAFTCSRSNSVKNAAADLLYLEKMSKVRGRSRLSGIITQSIESSVEGEESFYNLLDGRVIRVTGHGKDIKLKTDENGVYEVYDLPVGRYKITPEKINGFKFSDDQSGSTEIELKAKSHAEMNFYFSIDNSISGKLFDTNGNAMEDVCLHLLPARGKKKQYFYQGDCTDKTGSFKFERIPAGTYVVVINEEGKITSDEPFGTFFYPSATKREDAAEITIGAGDFLENLIVNAPYTAEVVTITGVLTFADGKPAIKESVEFFAETENKKTRGEFEKDARAATDAKGRFSIKILKGQKGVIYGSMITFVGEYVNCPKLDKLIRAKGDSVETIETPTLRIEAVNDLSEVELKFPFTSCQKAKIE